MVKMLLNILLLKWLKIILLSIRTEVNESVIFQTFFFGV